MQNKDTVMRFYTFSASIMNLGYKKSCRNFWEGYPGSFFSKFIPLQESIIKKVHQTKVTDSYRLDSTIVSVIAFCSTGRRFHSSGAATGFNRLKPIENQRRRLSMSREAQYVVDTRSRRKPKEFFERRRCTVSRPLSNHSSSSIQNTWQRLHHTNIRRPARMTLQ